MTRSVTVLLLVLLLQCGITAVVFWPEQKTMGSATEPALAHIEADTIDELRITDEFDNEAVLSRSGKQWLLPDLENLPADPDKVDTLLQALAAPAEGWPVARSPAARQRFQVADYYYQRRLTLLSAGKKQSVVYLGTSPGFHKVHARNESQDAIYSIALNTYDAPAISGAWLEPRLLQVRAPVRIDTDLYNLRLEDGRWLSGTGGTPDPQELEKLISALKTLQVEGVADEDLQRELSTAEADLVLQIQSLAGDATLELVTLDNEHFIHSTEFPLFFKLSAYDFDRLTGLDAGLISGEVSRQ